MLSFAVCATLSPSCPPPARSDQFWLVSTSFVAAQSDPLLLLWIHVLIVDARSPLSSCHDLWPSVSKPEECTPSSTHLSELKVFIIHLYNPFTLSTLRTPSLTTRNTHDNTYCTTSSEQFQFTPVAELRWVHTWHLSIQSLRMMFHGSVARWMRNSLSGLLTWDWGRQSTRMTRNLILGPRLYKRGLVGQPKQILATLVRETWRNSLWTLSSRHSERMATGTLDERGQQAPDKDFDMRQSNAEAIQDHINREEMMSLSVQNSAKIALDEKRRSYQLIRKSALSQSEIARVRDSFRHNSDGRFCTKLGWCNFWIMIVVTAYSCFFFFFLMLSLGLGCLGPCQWLLWPLSALSETFGLLLLLVKPSSLSFGWCCFLLLPPPSYGWCCFPSLLCVVVSFLPSKNYHWK